MKINSRFNFIIQNYLKIIKLGGKKVRTKSCSVLGLVDGHNDTSSMREEAGWHIYSRSFQEASDLTFFDLPFEPKSNSLPNRVRIGFFF